MPNYSLWTYDAIFDELKKHGAPIGTFNQSTFRTKVGQKGGQIQASVAGQSLGEGYCAGVCLDWARRVLLSPATRPPGYLTYGYGAILDGKGSKEGRTLQNSQERAFASVGRMGQAWVAHNSLGWQAKGGETSEVTPASWAGKATELAADHPKKKAFTQLEMLSSKNSVYESGELWLTELMANGFRAGGVSKVGFGRVDKGGHAVAVWQRKQAKTDPDSFYFFDPNYGVFSYNEEGVRAAIKILFYRTLMQTPVYESCASIKAQRMNYIVFGARPAGGAVAPQGGANAYGVAARSLPNSPATRAPVVPAPEPEDSPLKALLKKELAEASRHVEKFGGHPAYQSGYVKISFKLKALYVKSPPTATKVIVEHAGESAMTRTHMEQVIAML